MRAARLCCPPHYNTVLNSTHCKLYSTQCGTGDRGFDKEKLPFFIGQGGCCLLGQDVESVTYYRSGNGTIGCTKVKSNFF